MDEYNDLNLALPIESIDVKNEGENLPKEVSSLKKRYDKIQSQKKIVEGHIKRNKNARLFIEKEYGINALSMDSVKFGETILLNEYCKKTKLDKKYVKELRSPADTVKLLDVILPFIKYKNPE